MSSIVRTLSATAPVIAKGDLLVATGPGTFVRLPAGTPGQVLTVDPTTASGLRWSDGVAPALTGWAQAAWGQAAWGAP